MAAVNKTSDGIVVISYDDLASGADLAAHVEAAFGDAGLGIVLVSGVPGLVEKRKTLLPLAHKFGQLPADVQNKYEHPESSYSFGWSLGKEKMTDGRPDIYKGSFYNNPTVDVPTEDPELIKKYPDSCSPNIWPKEDLPELEPAFKALGTLIRDVGAMVGRQCDAFATAKLKGYPGGLMEKVVADSRMHKARLLHYLPVNTEPEVTSQDAWCGWHNDHSVLTGLVSAMYIEGDQEDITPPSSDAGLYIRDHKNDLVKAKIPKDMLAFQLGQAAQVLTGNQLLATPHCVRTLPWPASKGISRNTLAVFLEPNWDLPIDAPAGIKPEEVKVKQWSPGQNWAQFSAASVALYY